MSVAYTVQSLLNTQLKAFTDVTGDIVAWEGTEYDPSPQSSYLRPKLLIGQASAASIGPDGFEQLIGLFQIDCLYPIGGGYKAASEKADAVCEQFKRGTILTSSGGFRLRIKRSYPGTAIIENKAWYFVPVTVEWVIGYAQ